jgi:predicted hotdog family 3-hydroxylacyl-ACP dehydratase
VPDQPPPLAGPLPRERIRELVPHAGAMCLLDRMLTYDAGRIVCVATSHHDRDNPLRRDGVLGAVCGVEYAAQAMALHGALQGTRDQARAGYLVSLRDVRCLVATLDELPGDLEIMAEQQAQNGVIVAYRFDIRAAGRLLLGGRATVILDAG